MLEFYKNTQPKARKEHICDLCNQLINKGEIYYNYSGKYDGEIFNDKYHLTCQRIINAYCDDNNDREYDNDSIQDWLNDKHCLDCDLHKNDACQSSVLTCSLIRKQYEFNTNN